VKFDYVVQVDEVIGCAKLGESDVFHHPIDLDPFFLTPGPFPLDLSVRFPSHFCPILGRFPYAIKIAFVQHLNVMFFFISTLLDCTNVVDSLYNLL
jgi:hypothetical protein